VVRAALDMFVPAELARDAASPRLLSAILAGGILGELAAP